MCERIFELSEEKRRWYLSNAEVQMYRARTPIWAKSEMYFQVMMPDVMNTEHSNKDTSSGEIDTSFGEIEIERIPVPVFDHLQDFKEVQEAG